MENSSFARGLKQRFAQTVKQNPMKSNQIISESEKIDLFE